MKRLYAILMVMCAWMDATAQTQTLFDNDWTFTQNGKTANVNYPTTGISMRAPTPQREPQAQAAAGILAVKANITKSSSHQRASW